MVLLHLVIGTVEDWGSFVSVIGVCFTFVFRSPPPVSSLALYVCVRVAVKKFASVSKARWEIRTFVKVCVCAECDVWLLLSSV